ncbi:hypothetical protein [Winogradskyella aurantiaca]|uniref:hypothetical protein n=1 Tax=Winogradskyella aurantiaca TaxID=2219558 RepID=UPI000E1E2413|nr:hypothetical protein [Winogradskyella aurantiaca]
MKKNKSQCNDFNEKLSKVIDYLKDLSNDKREELFVILRKVQDIQKSDLNTKQKTQAIKRVMWKEQSVKSKLFIGGFIGTVAGLFIFGTGGIGIAGLGGAIGIWGFLAGTAGGILVSSLVQNFEKINQDN